MPLLDISGKDTNAQLTADLEKAQTGLGTEVGAQFRKDLAEKMTKENEAKIQAEIEKKTTSAEFMGYAGKTLDMWKTFFTSDWQFSFVFSKPGVGDEPPVDIVISGGNNCQLEDVRDSVNRSIEYRNKMDAENKLLEIK